MIEVELPDGTIAEFPAGTSNDVIKQALRRRFATTVDPSTNQPAGVPEYAPPGVEGYDPQTGDVSRAPRSRLASAAHGAADAAGFGFTDELASYPASWVSGVPREQVLSEMRGLQGQAREDNPWSYMGGQIGGGLAQGIGIAGGGLSAAANAARAGGGLGRVAIGSAIDGAAFGALQGAGGGEDLASRAMGGTAGLVAGGAVGGIAPYALAALQAAARPITAPLLSRLRPEAYANRALGEGLRRSGMSADDVAASLSRAQADDQAMFMAADSMGHSGQRMLSTVARTPNEMRQRTVEALTNRQVGQGDRLSQFLAEGFDATDTAAQRTAALTAARDAASDAAFGAARRGAGAVNVSGAVNQIDDVLQPGATRLMRPGNDLANDTVESALSRARSLLTDGRSNLTDFNSVYRARQDIADWVSAAKRAGRGNQARLLRGVRNELDNALAAASPQYRSAMQRHQQASRVIDAVDVGGQSASGRVRSTDSIQRFNALTPDEQAAFRAGYADPLIAKVESTSMPPTTNKARPLMTPKTGDEFPAFAAPGRADQLGRRISREQRMFETANAALGGSKTADNLADAADMAQFDPEILEGLLSGSPVRSVLTSVGRRIAAEAKGMSPRVVERVAEALIETNPEIARRLLTRGAGDVSRDEMRRAILSALTASGAGSAAGRYGSGRPLEITVTPR